jgi:hypothetical protein
MKHFLESNADTVAVAAGLFLAILVVAGYVYGVSDIAGSFDKAINPSELTIPSPTYNIEGAANLNLKGLNANR